MLVGMRGAICALLLLGCSVGTSEDPASISGLGGSTGAAETGVAATGETMPPETDGDDDSGSPPTTTPPGSTTGAPEPVEMDCWYQADDFGAGMLELDVDVGSTERLSFTVRGVPGNVTAATLHFDSHDADHPGEEGEVFVNGDGPFDLPANAGWNNMDGTGEIDVFGATVEGDNVIEFGAGSFAQGSFYRIGNVQLQVTATVVECPQAPEGPAIERTVEFTEAIYTERHNWVLRCDGFEYAYTARGDEHVPLDCDGLYAPDLTRSGTATFHFDDVVGADYEVQIRSRHTTNRNPNGALFIVDGVGVRIQQNDDADFTTDIWGEAYLEGDIDVVLDSTMENESDSVIWVRIVPL